MTAEPLNSPAERAHVRPVAAVAAADDENQHRHRLTVSADNQDTDPWLLPQPADDDSHRWKGKLMSRLNHYTIIIITYSHPLGTGGLPVGSRRICTRAPED